MHEMSLAESLLQLVEDTARREKARTVTAVFVDIGALASVETEALRFCFEAVAKDGLAAHAQLNLDIIAGAGWCMVCRQTVPLGERWGLCPQCGSAQVQATQGTEMRLREIEID